jgi:hypothetical protein
MSDRSQASYSGSWKEIYEAHEFPHAEPPEVGFARTLVLSGIAIKQVAANLPNGENLVTAATQAMMEWEDAYFGVPARPVPTLTLAASLAAFASILQKGELQTAIQEEATRIARKAFAASTLAQPPGVKAAWC